MLADRRLVAALAAIVGMSTGAIAQAAPPAVQVMVVGSTGAILSGPRTVSASAVGVKVGSRSCAVGAATPLAALADLHGPMFLLRDYGHCGSSPSGAGELFVYSLAGEQNRGQNGWEYKVNNRSGSTGAGDQSGAQGNGRLLTGGQRVLWFWCQAYGGGCQRTLEVSAASTVGRGGSLSVKVTGYDNEGHGAPVAGAIVTLGSDFASTAGSGRASLIAPSTAGRYTLSATRRGLVPAFPQTVQVR
jgi:hypothetical protein